MNKSKTKQKQSPRPDNVTPEFRAMFAQFLTSIGPSQGANQLRNKLAQAALTSDMKEPTCNNH